jgi:hypothetical protein
MSRTRERSVTMVAISASALKTAFRKTFPDKSAKELWPLWVRFWASIVLTAKVEKVLPEKAHLEQLLSESSEGEEDV